MNKVMYHCEECEFDLCEKCRNKYPDIHKHHLKFTNLKNVSEKNKNYIVWNCDAISFTPCPLKGEK